MRSRCAPAGINWSPPTGRRTIGTTRRFEKQRTEIRSQKSAEPQINTERRGSRQTESRTRIIALSDLRFLCSSVAPLPPSVLREQRRTIMPLRNLAWLLIVPALFALGLAVCYSAPRPDRDYALVRQFVDVMAEVDANFYRKL